MTFLELAEQVLRTVNKPLTVKEIWSYAVTQGWNNELNSKGKTPDQTLGAQLRETAKRPDSIFTIITTKPVRISLNGQPVSEPAQPKSKPIVKQVAKAETQPSYNNYLEKDLHPFLAYFGSKTLKCYCKTINHSTSDKKGYGEWVHPDMVGCIYPIEEWDDEVLGLSSEVGNTSVKFLSFELKRTLNISSLRENFFQTVSNSSWANEAYLVAAEISTNTDFLAELSRLSSSFGIGIIQLDVHQPEHSKVMYPATTRDNLDWETLNKLATKNADFKQFIKRVRIDLSSKEIRKEQYDKVLTKEQLVKSVHG